MIELEIRKGNLFDALNRNDVFVHACNAQGVWGSGIAKEFKKRFPSAYNMYRNKVNNPGDGYCIYVDSGIMIGCLITSENYGKLKDPPEVILDNTYEAIKNMLNNHIRGDITIHSPKINAGLFEVPWKDTEEVIVTVCNEETEHNIKWIVWEL